MTIINLKRYARSLLLSTTNMFLPYTSASILYKKSDLHKQVAFI